MNTPLDNKENGRIHTISLSGQFKWIKSISPMILLRKTIRSNYWNIYNDPIRYVSYLPLSVKLDFDWTGDLFRSQKKVIYNCHDLTFLFISMKHIYNRELFLYWRYILSITHRFILFFLAAIIFYGI
jgi:hypothetical protein